MATNQFGVTEFDADPETAAELRRLAQQEKIAAAMMARGQQPIQGQMVGQTYVPASITQGLAQMFNAYAGRKASDAAEQGYKGLAGRKADETAAAISAYKRGTMGTPEQPMGPPTEEGAMGVQPAMTPTPDQRRQAIIEAAVSTNPRLSKMGQMDFQMDERKEARADAIEQQKFTLQENHKNRMLQLELAKASDAEKAREQRSHQEQMVRLAASLRQPRDEGAPVAVLGPDGNPILVSRKDAIGKSPAPTKSGANISTVDAKSIDKSLEKSSGANGALQLLDQADELYGKYESNRAEPILGGLARVGAAVGLADPNKAKDYELADQIAKDLGVIKLGLIGGSDTERELKVAIDTSPSPDKTVGTNREIIKNQRKAIEILQSEPDFKTEWVNKHGSLSAMDKATGDTYGKAWRKFQKDKWGGGEKPAGAPAAATSEDAGYEAWKKSKGLK